MGIGIGLGLGLGGGSGSSGGLSLPTLAFASAVARAEGASGTTVFTFTLNLTRNGSTAAIPFNWTVTGNGANPVNAADFVGGVLPSGADIFAAGETSKAIVVNVAGDGSVEPDEGFTISATAMLPLAGASALGSILNDDVLMATPRSLTNNAVRVFGPGHGSGNGIAPGTGAAIPVALSYVNESKQPIDTLSLVMTGKYLTSTGSANVGNDVPLTIKVEYPSGTVVGTVTQGGSPNIVIPNGGIFETDRISLTTSVPAGATFVLRAIVAALPTTSRYPITRDGNNAIVNLCGIVGVMSTTTSTANIAKVSLFAVGDSISTNNGSVWYTAAAGRCPCLQMSIGGTTAASYGANNAANFKWQMDVAKAINATTLAGNFSTNDVNTGSSLAALQANITNLKTAATAAGMVTYWATMTPYTALVAVTASAVTVGSNQQFFVAVPDASRFTVGSFYSLLGATSTGVNGNRVCIAADTTTNVLTFLSPNIVDPVVGTVTLRPSFATLDAKLVQPSQAAYAAGSGSVRGQFNAWVRSGVFAGYIDWADAAEPFRDAGRWAIGGETSYLLAQRSVTLSSIINTSRFGIAAPSIPNNSFAGGLLQWMTGGNRASAGSGNGSGTTDITLNGPPTNAAANGDTAVVSLNVSYASDDGLHPRAGLGNFGGQQMIQVPTNNWLTALVA